MKPLDRYKAMIANAFQAHETSQTVDVDLVLAEARQVALKPAADGTVPSGAAARQALDTAVAAALASLTAVGETREAGLLALAVRNSKGQIVPTPWFVQEAKRVLVRMATNIESQMGCRHVLLRWVSAVLFCPGFLRSVHVSVVMLSGLSSERSTRRLWSACLLLLLLLLSVILGY
jgi:hypothetical protein